MPETGTLGRRLLAELVGTGMLVTVVVGSGIAAQNLSPGDVGLQLLENSIATAFGLAVLILMLGPVSGAHFNPVVSAADWWLGRRAGTGLTGREAGAYSAAQTVGGVVGAVLANVMFDVPTRLSTRDRSDWHLWVGEVVATAGLVALIFALARAGRGAWAAPAVGAYIGAAYWFTSSTSFANPAVTVGRVFSDTFAGIEPSSAPGFVAAQLVGGLLGVVLVRALYPDVAMAAGDVVVPHYGRQNMSETPSVLFVCVHNAGRSQMAMGFMSHLGAGRVEVRSAGTAPAEQVNPVAVEAMREVGIDITAERPKVLTDEAVRASDVVITMGCGDECPFYPGKRYLDWQLDDPAGQGIEAVRPIRDQIRTRVEGLLTELVGQDAPAT